MTLIVNVLCIIYSYIILYFIIPTLNIGWYFNNILFAFYFQIWILYKMLKRQDQKLCTFSGWIAILLTPMQPIFILYIYIKDQIRGYFYAVIFSNIIFHGSAVCVTLCYFIVPHPKSNFTPSLLEELLIVFYFILYFFSILSIYPLFMPLQSINWKHFLFKICSFSLQIIRILFTVFLLVSFYFGYIKIINMVSYIYKFYLITLFEITPALCIWIGFYTLNWGIVEKIQRFSTTVRAGATLKLIMCGSCILITFLILCIVYPILAIVMSAIFGIYWWILLEFYFCNIFDSFIFANSLPLFDNEMINTTPDMTLHNTWKIIYEYLHNINDALSYEQRLCILHYLSHSTDADTPEETINILTNDIRSIIMRRNTKMNYVFRSCGWIKYLSLQFLCCLFMRCDGQLIYNGDQSIVLRDDFGLLHFYNFPERKFTFKWKHIIYVMQELLGVFVLIPIFILSHIIAIIMCPIVLFVFYFYVFIDEYG
eukprot:411506_1